MIQDRIGYDKEISDNIIQKLISTKTSQNTNIVVGLIRDNALHITPIQQIMQMRPSFDGMYKEEIIEDIKKQSASAKCYDKKIKNDADFYEKEKKRVAEYMKNRYATDEEYTNKSFQ